MKGIYSPKMLELSDVRHVKVSMTKKARSQFVMFANSERKQAISAEDSNSYLDIRLF